MVRVFTTERQVIRGWKREDTVFASFRFESFIVSFARKRLGVTSPELVDVDKDLSKCKIVFPLFFFGEGLFHLWVRASTTCTLRASTTIVYISYNWRKMSFSLCCIRSINCGFQFSREIIACEIIGWRLCNWTHSSHVGHCLIMLITSMQSYFVDKWKYTSKLYHFVFFCFFCLFFVFINIDYRVRRNVLQRGDDFLFHGSNRGNFIKVPSANLDRSKKPSLFWVSFLPDDCP